MLVHFVILELGRMEFESQESRPVHIKCTCSLVACIDFSELGNLLVIFADIISQDSCSLN